MTVAIVLMSFYLSGIIGCWFMFRMQSPKYLDKWLSESCRIKPIWFIPIMNNIMVLLLFIVSVDDLWNLLIKRKGTKLPKSKWLNTDL